MGSLIIWGPPRAAAVGEGVLSWKRMSSSDKSNAGWIVVAGTFGIALFAVPAISLTDGWMVACPNEMGG